MKWAIIFVTLLVVCFGKPLNKSSLKRLPHKCLPVLVVRVEENIEEIVAKPAAEVLQALETPSVALSKQISEVSKSLVIAEHLVKSTTTENSANHEYLLTTNISERSDESEEVSSETTISPVSEPPSATKVPSVNERSDKSADSTATTVDLEYLATTEALTIIERLHESEELDLTTEGSEPVVSAASGAPSAVERLTESEKTDSTTLGTVGTESAAATDSLSVVDLLNESKEIDTTSAAFQLEVVTATEVTSVGKDQNEPQDSHATTEASAELAATEPPSIDNSSMGPEAATVAPAAPETPLSMPGANSETPYYIGNVGEAKESGVRTEASVISEAPSSENPQESSPAPEILATSETPIFEASAEHSSSSQAPTVSELFDELQNSSLTPIVQFEPTSISTPLQRFIAFTFFDRSAKNSSLRRFLNYLRSFKK